VPDVLALSLLQARIDVVHALPLIASAESPFYGARAIAKRCSDIVLALCIL